MPRFAWEPVAQSVEHLTFNQRVSGSNPDGLTNSYSAGGVSIGGNGVRSAGAGAVGIASGSVLGDT